MKFKIFTACAILFLLFMWHKSEVRNKLIAQELTIVKTQRDNKVKELDNERALTRSRDLGKEEIKLLRRDFNASFRKLENQNEEVKRLVTLVIPDSMLRLFRSYKSADSGTEGKATKP